MVAFSQEITVLIVEHMGPFGDVSMMRPEPLKPFRPSPLDVGRAGRKGGAGPGAWKLGLVGWLVN